MKARLHPIWVGGRDGYRYSVLFNGKLLVERSRDPECDVARALLAQGITGKLTSATARQDAPGPSSILSGPRSVARARGGGTDFASKRTGKPPVASPTVGFG